MPGTLTKMEIVSTIQTENGYTFKKVTDIVNTCLIILRSTLASGEDVLVSRYGKFQIRDKGERKGRNQASGNYKIT